MIILFALISIYKYMVKAKYLIFIEWLCVGILINVFFVVFEARISDFSTKKSSFLIYFNIIII
jgi:hypothetical protein